MAMMAILCSFTVFTVGCGEPAKKTEKKAEEKKTDEKKAEEKKTS